MEILESKKFDYLDTRYEVDLTSDNQMSIISDTGRYNCRISFSNHVDEQTQRMIFSAIANSWWIKLVNSSYKTSYSIDFFDANFIEFLMNNKIPDHLAVRLAMVGQGMSNAEDLFNSYRALNKPFYFNVKTGTSAFEYYLLLAKSLGTNVADFVVLHKGSSLETLAEAYSILRQVNVHPDAAHNIASLGPESLEAFLLFSKFMRLSRRQDAMVVSRILAETEDFDWNRAGNLLKRFENKETIQDLFPADERELATDFADESYRRSITSELNESYSSRGFNSDSLTNDNWGKLFVILIEKYGMQAILDGLNKLKEDRVNHERSVAAFIIAIDYIATTGDNDTHLDWILNLSGELDSAQRFDDDA